MLFELNSGEHQPTCRSLADWVGRSEHGGFAVHGGLYAFNHQRSNWDFVLVECYWCMLDYFLVHDVAEFRCPTTLRKVATLVGMGFTEKQAKDALDGCSGNVERADPWSGNGGGGQRVFQGHVWRGPPHNQHGTTWSSENTYPR